ncbi:MAG: hypothetical protein PHN31_04210 [Candidatus Gracilibacteria bacterium]|nr:hypothetical protein [Candidatus Gracilibacteria bacterium]
MNNSRYTYNNRRNKVKKTLKDYMIPVGGIVVILIIIISIFFSGGDSTDDTSGTQNQTTSSAGLSVSLDDGDTEAYIMNEKGDKQAISGSTKLLPNQELIVKQGTTSIESESLGSLKLNKMGEMELDENSVLKLISSDLWINAKKGFSVNTTFAKIKISEGSTVSVSQNEALSTIYVISGSAEVSNLVGKKILLGNAQKVTISNQDASNKSLDLTLSKDNIDEFFKSSEWYTKNNGDSFGASQTETSTGSTGSLSMSGDGNSLIELDGVSDEAVVSSSKVNISGKYFNDFVASIGCNGLKAKVDPDTKTFSLGSITLTKKENDLVFKLYDSGDTVIGKVVYTLYYNGAITQNTDTTTSNNTTTSTTSGEYGIKNYPIDTSEFKFTAPGVSPYTTSETFVTIRGQTPSGVSKVIVNGHTLSSFNGTTWRYHADESNGNMKDGVNIYEVKYYGKGGDLLHTNSFIINKTPKTILSGETGATTVNE